MSEINPGNKNIAAKLQRLPYYAKSHHRAIDINPRIPTYQFIFMHRTLAVKMIGAKGTMISSHSLKD